MGYMDYAFVLGRILVPVTFLMHNYWIETDMMQRINQRVTFRRTWRCSAPR